MKAVKALSIFVVLFLAMSASAQVVPFQEATGTGSSELGTFNKWTFANGGDTYELNVDGRGGRRDSKGKVTRIDLKLAKGDILSGKLYWAVYETDLVLLYEITNGDAGAGAIARLNGASLKPRWATADIGGFNVSQGLIDGQEAYLAASGFVGRFDLDGGKYLWKHDDLYRKFTKDGAFNIIEMPEIDGETVVFTEKVEGKEPNLLIVDKGTGRILRTVVK